MTPDSEKYLQTLESGLNHASEHEVFFAEYKARKLYEWCKSPSHGKKILDVGCADGLMTSFIDCFFESAEVYGTDYSREHIEFARGWYPEISFETTEATLPYPDNTFDIAYVSNVVHHVSREQQETFIQELARVTRPGGFVVIMELNPCNIATALRFQYNHDENNAHMMTPWYTKNLLRPYGKVSTQFFAFFKQSWLRPFEPYITKIPFGSMYAVICKKN